MNAARGEVTLACEGHALTLCLTLGALAEIETALGGDLKQGMARLGAGQLIAILRALLKGGGEHEAAARVEQLTLDAGDAARAIAACFARAGEGAA